MTWWAVRVRPARADADDVGAWLVAASGQAVAHEDDGALLAHMADGAAARLVAERLRNDWSLEAALAPVADEDWTVRWRNGIAARRIGRLVITPSWLPEATDPGAVVVDPESAFGTGEHGSTRTALALLDRHLAPGGLMLDLGSGSGIIAIAAARLGAARAIGIETDADANLVAAANARRNGVADRVAFLEGDAARLAPLAGPAGLVVSNILRTVNVLLLPAIRQALAPGGVAVFAGMEAPEAPLFLPELARAGFVVADDAADAGWWGVAASVP